MPRLKSRAQSKLALPPCSYESVGDLNEDLVKLFALGISIHAHPAWAAASDEWRVHAEEMVRRSRRLQDYWLALVVEYFHNVKSLGVWGVPVLGSLVWSAWALVPESAAADKLATMRAEREHYISSLPVLNSTHVDLLKVISHMKQFDKGKYFSKPAHKIWTSLAQFWVPQPVDLGTMKTRVTQGYYTCYQHFLDE